MATIELKNVSHSYSDPEIPRDEREWAVKDLSITWEDGTANALLGPSGCGKTTLLNIISGLLTPSEGQVLIDGQDMTAMPPKERKVAQVFQFPVVYGSMNVFNNLAFPLRNQKQPEGLVRDKVREVAELLDLTPHLKHNAAKLNPAERQKISLGRGIIRDDTSAILLDEPLTVIDPKLKWHLRRKLKQVQRDTGKTMIYVTHDQHEALTFAQDVTIVRAGRLVQKGSPDELHSEPASPFIGYFIGSPGMNVLDVTPADGKLDFGSFQLPASDELLSTLRGAGGKLQIGLRPEYVEVRGDTETDDPAWTRWNVTIIEDTGAYRIYTMERDDLRLKARVPERITSREGDTVSVRFPEQHIKVFSDERRIA
ncbi:ABC transporter ATP-binding protein [Desulfohalovibrio reitneri]|uniref:ABC transporter ATP-binding protein n=1 Tax=Desulfohalovibrio reitneri TaxID=1307759 RepID=UPI0004A71D86|nr:ABC transporter ATP-binding protein [Desulfohalovibrio reitneri]